VIIPWLLVDISQAGSVTAMQQATLGRERTPYREPVGQTLFKAVQQKILVPVLRQVVSNPDLHIFQLKLYRYADSFGHITLTKFIKRLGDPEFIRKVERHLADEERHTALFDQLLLEMGVTPAFTEAESGLKWIQTYIAQLDLLHSRELGIADEGFDSDKTLDIPEIIRYLVFVQGQEMQGTAWFTAHLRALDHDKESRVRKVLEDVMVDEQRHVDYLTEELHHLSQQGYQPLIDEARRRCRKIRASQRLPIGEALSTIPRVLEEMLHYRPVGAGATVAWSLFKGVSVLVGTFRRQN
jgi:rubrerythrin